MPPLDVETVYIKKKKLGSKTKKKKQNLLPDMVTYILDINNLTGGNALISAAVALK